MRPSRSIPLVLALGLITTVAVAWGLALFRTIPMYPRTRIGAFMRWDQAWNVAEAPITGVLDRWWGELSDTPTLEERKTQAPAAISAATSEISAIAAERPGIAAITRPPSWGTFAQPSPPPLELDIGADTAFGWPRVCLWHSATSRYNQATSSVTGGTLHGGLLVRGEISVRGHDYLALPLRPIWSGLAANTVLYAALWWLLLFIPGIARIRLRARRGACTACGYDLRATSPGSPCPECGSSQRGPTAPVPPA
jgi:hypothetical protein